MLAVFWLASGVANAGPIHTESRHIVRWPIEPGQRVSYSISNADAFVRAAVMVAIRRWEDVGSSYVEFVEETENPDDAGIVLKIASLNAAIAGQASMSVDGYGHITGCTVELAAGLGDMEGTLTHEIGHCLGLMHSTVPGAVMSYRREAGSSLNDDDRLAISRLYPQGDHDLPVGCVSVQDVSRGDRNGGGPGNGSGSTLLMLGVLGLFWAVQKLFLTFHEIS